MLDIILYFFPCTSVAPHDFHSVFQIFKMSTKKNPWLGFYEIIKDYTKLFNTFIQIIVGIFAIF